MRRTRISLSVYTSQPEVMTRTLETLSRAVAGLAMEDIDVMLFTSEDESEES